MSYTVHFTDLYVSLAGVPLSTPAWELLNAEVLLSAPPSRGNNVQIPNANGTRARRRRPHERRLTLEMHITGSVLPDGTEPVSGAVGLALNVLTLRNALAPPSTGHSLVPLVLHWHGEDLGADVQVENFEIGTHIGTVDVSAIIDITIPAGGLYPL